MKYCFGFDFCPIQGYAWNDFCGGSFFIEAESEEAALEYGKRLAEYFVFSAWPEESWYDLCGKICEDCDPELEFRVGDVPQEADVERWLKGKGLTSSRDYFKFIAGEPVGNRYAGPGGTGLSREDYLNHIWIPCVEITVIREMTDHQRLLVAELVIEEPGGNWVSDGPDGGLLRLIDWKQGYSSEKLSAWYEKTWLPLFNAHLPKLRNWEFDYPVYKTVKMEQLLLRQDELFRAILGGGDSCTPVFRIWKMRGWGEGGAYFFPMLAGSEQQKKHWTKLLTPPVETKARVVLRKLFAVNTEYDYFKDILLFFPIMLAVFGIAFAIVYWVPQKWQWWMFTGLFSAAAVCAFVMVERMKWKKLIASIPGIREIYITNDDLLKPGIYCLTITASSDQTFIGSREVLRVAGYLKEAMPESSEQIRKIVTEDLLLHGGTVIYKKGINTTTEEHRENV